MIRDKTAFHYDKLNLAEAVSYLAPSTECRVYLARIRRTPLLCGVSLRLHDHLRRHHRQDERHRWHDGRGEDAQGVNVHLLKVLYGLIKHLLEPAIEKSAAASRTLIPVDAAKLTSVDLPLFVDVGRVEGETARPRGARSATRPQNHFFAAGGNSVAGFFITRTTATLGSSPSTTMASLRRRCPARCPRSRGAATPQQPRVRRRSGPTSR
jgi:hypothetical protein